MDHLPRPYDSNGPLLEVPFVANIPWDFLDFGTFPSRHGFLQKENGSVMFDHHSTEDIASLIQSWLYFGLLAELFGNRVNRDDFKRHIPATSGKPRGIVVDSTPLERIIKNRICPDRSDCPFTRYPSKSAPEATAVASKLSSFGFDIGNLAEQIERHPVFAQPPLPEMLFSIRILYLPLKYTFDVPYLGSISPSNKMSPGDFSVKGTTPGLISIKRPFNVWLTLY